MDARLLLTRHEANLSRAFDQHQSALNDGRHLCCACGTPASVAEPHCTRVHMEASRWIEGELTFDRETRRLLAEKGENRSEG